MPLLALSLTLIIPCCTKICQLSKATFTQHQWKVSEGILYLKNLVMPTSNRLQKFYYLGTLNFRLSKWHGLLMNLYRTLIETIKTPKLTIVALSAMDEPQRMESPNPHNSWMRRILTSSRKHRRIPLWRPEATRASPLPIQALLLEKV